MISILETATAIQKQIITKVEGLLKINIKAIHIPLQGIDSEVFIITDEKGKEYAIKYSADVLNDVLALNLIREKRIEVPVPKLYGYFPLEDKIVMILEKINFPVLELIPVEEHPKYIPSMIENLKRIHDIKSDKAGPISDFHALMSWKELLLFKYSGKHPWFNWNKIMSREGVNKELLQKSIESIIIKIKKQTFMHNSYSFLHTDFNQRNLFVNPDSNEIASIIDWSEAMFGDPLYDFARVRMYIWHFNLNQTALEDYYKSLTPEEIKVEDHYLVSQVLDYITWYSETKNEFNLSRLFLHQKFLREYQWE